jgi:hypothetical protein
MEKNILTEVNRNLNLMGLNNNLLLESLPSFYVKLGQKALSAFEGIVGKTRDTNVIEGLFKGKGTSDDVLLKLRDFFEKSKKNMDLKKYSFNSYEELDALITAIIKYEPGYFVKIFSNGFIDRNTNEVADFNKTLGSLFNINTNNLNENYIRQFLDNKEININPNVEFMGFVEHLVEYLVKFKEGKVLFDTITAPDKKWGAKFYNTLEKFQLTKSWGLVLNAIRLSSKNNSDELLRNFRVKINEIVSKLDENNSAELRKEMYDYAYKYMLAYKMKESTTTKQILENFYGSTDNEGVRVMVKNIEEAYLWADRTGKRNGYTIFEAIDNNSFDALRKIRLNLGYNIITKFDEVENKMVENFIKKFIKYDNILPFITKALNNRPLKTALFGLMPDKNVIALYLTRVKYFAEKDKLNFIPKTMKYLKAYFTIQVLGLVRKIVIYGYLPAISGSVAYLGETTYGVKIKNQISKLTGSDVVYDEDKEGDWKILLLKKVGEHYNYMVKYVINSQFNSVQSIGSPIFKNIVFPAFIASITESLSWKFLQPLFINSFVAGRKPNFDYTDTIDSWFVKKINENGNELRDNNPETEQAGGSGISVNDPTWSYNTVPIPSGKFIDINFQFSRTQKVLVNNNNVPFRNVNSKIRILVSNNITITSIVILDNSNVRHTVVKKQ